MGWDRWVAKLPNWNRIPLKWGILLFCPYPLAPRGDLWYTVGVAHDRAS